MVDFEEETPKVTDADDPYAVSWGPKHGPVEVPSPSLATGALDKIVSTDLPTAIADYTNFRVIIGRREERDRCRALVEEWAAKPAEERKTANLMADISNGRWAPRKGSLK